MQENSFSYKLYIYDINVKISCVDRWTGLCFDKHVSGMQLHKIIVR